MILSQNQKQSSELFSAFPKYTKILEYFQKKVEPQTLFPSEIIDWKKPSYLNAQKAPCENTYWQSTF